MTLTLAETQALDFEALWRALPAETQLRIGSAVLQAEFLTLIETDGGFHAGHEDRLRAEALKDKVTAPLPRMIWDALPDLLPTEYDAAYPLWQILDNREPPASVNVRGMVGARELVRVDHEWFVPHGDQLVPIGGAVDLNCGPEAAPHDWLFWTIDDIEAERLRRHPEQVELNVDHYYGDDHADAA